MTLRQSSTPLEQQRTGKAIISLIDAIEKIDIEFEDLVSAMWTLLIQWNVEDGTSEEEFSNQLETVKDHFKMLKARHER